MTGEGLLNSYVVAGIALAGYSGIVAAYGSHARGEWSHRDRQLLDTLLGSSGGSSLLSALPLLLTSAGLDERTVWCLSSGFSVILQLVLMTLRAWGMSRSKETCDRERWLLITAYTGGAMTVVMQLTNCIRLGVAWPHLTTITWHLALAFMVFVRLIQPDQRA